MFERFFVASWAVEMDRMISTSAGQTNTYLPGCCKNATALSAACLAISGREQVVATAQQDNEPWDC
jgi:hypothetical protein